MPITNRYNAYACNLVLLYAFENNLFPSIYLQISKIPQSTICFQKCLFGWHKNKLLTNTTEVLVSNLLQQ